MMITEEVYHKRDSHMVNSKVIEQYKEKIELKDMIRSMQVIMGNMYGNLSELPIHYENTQTDLFGKTIPASFCIDVENNEDVLTSSKGSKKTTTVKWGQLIISTLNITNYDEIILFLRKIGLIEEKEVCPEWMQEVKMFDDEDQLDVINDSERIISEQKRIIEDANCVLAKNARYESILYTTGDDLVNVIFEILEEMLGCNLDDFVDEKNEDFCFEIDGTVFIGEIKGVNHNIKNENVSQLEVHYQKYFDEHEEAMTENVKALLIMNHQKNKPLGLREEVHEHQIRLAERNGSLIIETITFLQLFEQYVNGTKNRQECIEILRNNIGLLTL